MTFADPLVELQARRLRAVAAKAEARGAYIAFRWALQRKGVPDPESDPLVMRALANYEQADARYQAARLAHAEAADPQQPLAV